MNVIKKSTKPKNGRSKKIEFLQDSKYVIITYGKKVHRQICSIVPTVKNNSSAMRVEEGLPRFSEG